VITASSTERQFKTASKRVPARRIAQEIGLYDSDELADVVGRMAREALELLLDSSDVLVVGILRRGAPLAEMLGKQLAPMLGLKKVPRLDLSIKRYADDLTLLHPETKLIEEAFNARQDPNGKTVLLVDDLLYRGYSLQCAVNFLVRKGAAQVRTAVLVDRCAAVLPMRADIAGIKLAVAPSDIIECQVPPYEPAFQVRLVRRNLG
jgi:pyrimidine operon attenuation protein / uracil phosphoribosyltransferase